MKTHSLPIALLWLLSAARCLAAWPPTDLPYDDSAAEYLPLERWLQQQDTSSCLSDTRADILFALDGSESVSLTDFHLVVKSLVVDTVSRLEVGENFVQIGVLVFSSQVSQVIPIGKYPTKLELLTAVSQLAYDGGYTALDSAVEGCIAELGRRLADAGDAAATAASARKRLVVFVTDGRHTGSGTSVYLRDLLAQLHRRVTAAAVCGLGNSDSATLQLLATDPGLVFDPTAYPDYQAALYSQLNMRCTADCYKYERSSTGLRKVAATLVQYVNYLLGNFAAYRQRQAALAAYAGSLNASVFGLDADIRRTCDTEDAGLLRSIVTLRERVTQATNGSRLAGASVDAYISELIRRVNGLQKEAFDQGQTLAAEKTKLAGVGLEEDRMKADFQSRLDSKQAVRKAQESSLAALESRLAAYRQEVSGVAQAVERFANVSSSLVARLRIQESTYAARLTRLSSLTRQAVLLTAVQNGGRRYLSQARSRLALCRAQVTRGSTVLFAVRAGSGADFEALFNRDSGSFTPDADADAGAEAWEKFDELTAQRPMFKSPFLRQLHSVGYFRSVTWQFLDNVASSSSTNTSDNQQVLVASITMDTSRIELASLFSRARVTAAFPWVTAFANSIYAAQLPQFRPPAGAEFPLLFGDLTRYGATSGCGDIVGLFLVLTRPHRCYPEAVRFPQVFVSASPFGGPINRPVAELRFVTDRLPGGEGSSGGSTEAVDAAANEQLTELLLYVKSGAGYLHSLLLTSRFTPAAQLAEVDDLSQLTRHYKSSVLANLNLDNYLAIKLELFNSTGQVVASLRFKGPFAVSGNATSADGINLSSWAWFQSRYLDDAQPFDTQVLRQSARFAFYDSGVGFFTVGERLASANCQDRLYFLTLVDGAPTDCACFPGAASPGIYFTEGGTRPASCDQLTAAESLRLTGELATPLTMAG